jgi:GT2 family glycosyltransferase
VKKTKYQNLEVILVDNASTDGSCEFVKENYPWVRVIRNDKNLGFAEGNNVGLKASQGKYVILLNNDTEVDKDWVSELIKVAESDQSIGICACKIFFYDNKQRINSAGGLCDIYGYAIDRGLFKENNDQFQRTECVFYACGAAIMIRKEILSTIGYFDPVYFIYNEDVDLCWRAWLAGFKTVFVPTAIVFHKLSGTMGKKKITQKYLKERNRLRTLIKNYSLITLVKILPIYTMLKIGEMLLHVLFGNLHTALAILKAMYWNVTNISSTLKERHHVQAIRKISDRELQKIMVRNSMEFQMLINGYGVKYAKSFI